MAGVQARLDALARENAQLRADLEAARTLQARTQAEARAVAEELAQTRAWIFNARAGSVEYRMLAYALLCAAGAAPGRPNPDRPREYTTATLLQAGATVGMSRASTYRYAKQVFAAGLVRKRVSHPKEEGQFRTRTLLAPPSGLDWARTWADTARIGPPPPSEDHATEARRQAQQRERVKRILAECPECGERDVEMHCHVCRARRHVDTIPPAAPATRRRPRPPYPLAPTETPGNESQLDNASISMSESQVETCDPFAAVLDESLDPLHAEVPLERYTVAAGGQVVDARTGEAVAPLDAAVNALAPALSVFPDAVQMRQRQTESDSKYTSLGFALTPKHVKAHLEGKATLGTGLCWDDPTMPSGRACRAIAWDSDDHFDKLMHAAHRLAGKGLRTLLIQNPVDATRGHLWALLDAPIDATSALAVAEHLAPELAGLAERFPNPNMTNGGRLRLPGGCYLPVGAVPTPVRVALVTADGPLTWHEGTDPHAWAAIAGAVNTAAAITATWAPPDTRERLIPKHKRAQPHRRKPKRPAWRGRAGDDFFAQFNAAHPIESLVDVLGNHKFRAPWRADERTASVHLFDDGHWHDFGPGNRHGDAFDLWAALNGYWPPGRDRPDRKGAYRALVGGAP